MGSPTRLVEALGPLLPGRLLPLWTRSSSGRAGCFSSSGTAGATRRGRRDGGEVIPGLSFQRPNLYCSNPVVGQPEREPALGPVAVKE